MELGAPLWNIIYATVGIGVIAIVAMMSVQFQESNTDLDSKKGAVTTVTKIMQKAQKSSKSAERQKDPLKAAVLAQDALSLISGARLIASDDEIEQDSKIFVRELAQDTRAILRRSIDAVDGVIQHADNLMRAVQEQSAGGRR